MTASVPLTLLVAGFLTLLCGVPLVPRQSSRILATLGTVAVLTGLVCAVAWGHQRVQDGRARAERYQAAVAAHLLEQYNLQPLSTFQQSLPAKDNTVAVDVQMERGTDLVKCLLNVRKGPASTTAHCVTITP